MLNIHNICAEVLLLAAMTDARFFLCMCGVKLVCPPAAGEHERQMFP
jgi:hypothetical protein